MPPFLCNLRFRLHVLVFGEDGRTFWLADLTIWEKAENKIVKVETKSQSCDGTQDCNGRYIKIMI